MHEQGLACPFPTSFTAFALSDRKSENRSLATCDDVEMICMNIKKSNLNLKISNYLLFKISHEAIKRT